MKNYKEAPGILDSIKKIFRTKPPKICLVLGSGGTWGLAHIGVLKVLEKNGIVPNYIVGCSMGSVIGAIYALNKDLNKIEKISSELGKWNLIKLADVNIPKKSLITGKKIRNFLENIIADKTFSDTIIPIKIIATDLEKGEQMVLSRGSLLDAVMASSSIPGIFPPVKLDEKLLVDGGVINATPINVARSFKPDIIIGVDLTIKHKAVFKNPNIYQVLMRSFDILRNQSTKFFIEEDKNTIIIRPNVAKMESYKLYDLNMFIKEGEKATKKCLPQINALLND